MPNSYTTRDALVAALNAGGTLFGSTDDQDAFLASCIERASRLIDTATKREPGAYAVTTDTETRYFRGSGKHIQYLDEFCSSDVTLAVAETAQVDNHAQSGGTYTAYGSSNYWLLPDNAPQLDLPYTGIELDLLNGSKAAFYNYPRAVKVTATWGYAAATTDNITPLPDVEQATIVQAMKMYMRAKQGYQDVGAIESIGQLKHVKALDPEVVEMITHYKRVIL
jgi:hypothetical protein